ncbi:MAG: glycoside hydrolase family 2 TIM barrel-domain containing protein [Bacteroidota bacterium]
MKLVSAPTLLPFVFFYLIVLDIAAQTTVEKAGEDWVLMVDGAPFDVKGVTFGYDNDAANYDKYFTDLQFLGVNTIRVWGTNENTAALLDAAQAHDIKVMVGIWMRHGRPGMEGDDSFNYLEDEAGKEDMRQNALEAVKLYKNHPAVLTWGVGNEVYLNTATDKEKRAYSILLEEICSQMKKIDPNHPITSVEAWTFGMDWWKELVPSIDIYGLNSYGPGVDLLPDELTKRGIDKPYIITEFGVTGEWDIQEKQYGITVEPTDQDKYETIVEGYARWIKSKAACLGVYVFHYGNGNEFGSPWLLTHHAGNTRPQYWAIRHAYTGAIPDNYVPIIKQFQLADGQHESSTWISVQVEVADFENEELTFSFHYNQRTGSRKRKSQINDLHFRGNITDGFEIQMPAEDGAIKVYVNVKDTYGNVGIASSAVVVKGEAASQRKYLVPRAQLPFYVYQEGEDFPYVISAYMGNMGAIKVNTRNTVHAKNGEASLQITYEAPQDWYGLGLVDPADDWGEKLGGYDLTGASTFSFWARASSSKVRATIGFGLIGDDQPFPDTARQSMEIQLSTRWQQYSIDLSGLDLSCIRSGLVIYSGGTGSAHKIYFDDVVFE